MQQLLGMMCGMDRMNGLAAAAQAQPPQTRTRPPEERFQAQLQKLQDMGFTNTTQNIPALLATAATFKFMARSSIYVTVAGYRLFNDSAISYLEASPVLERSCEAGD